DVMALMSALAAQGHTVIIITHDRTVAAHAQRIIELRDGTVVSDTGPHIPGIVRLPPPELSAERGAAFLSGLGEAAHMAIRALRTNIFRTALTLLGIMIGVGSVVAMM